MTLINNQQEQEMEIWLIECKKIFSERHEKGIQEREGLEKLTGEKEIKYWFLSPINKSFVYFLVHRKETDTWSFKREELRHTGNCLRDLLE